MKKILVLGLVLVLCLSVVGIGYAGWFKNLEIAGTVNTGSVDAIFVEGTASDTDTKDASSITCVVDVNGVLQVVVDNAYPGITYTNTFSVKSTGSVPLHINSVDVTPPAPGVNVTIDLVDSAGSSTLPIQLHQNDLASGTVTVTVDQLIPGTETETENMDTGFSATIAMSNWNN